MRRRESRPEHRRGGSLVGGREDGYLALLRAGDGASEKEKRKEVAAPGVI